MAERRYTLILVPEGARAGVRQLSLTLLQLRRYLAIAAIVTLLALVGLISVFFGIGTGAGDGIIEENLVLKGRLRQLELKLDDVDLQLQRLRLYQTQLEDMPAEAVPGFGPLDDAEVAAAERLGEGVVVSRDALDQLDAGDTGLGEPMDELEGLTVDDPTHPGDTSDALLRMGLLEQRADRALSRLRLAEIQAGHLVESAEHWRAMRAAVPSEWPLAGVLTSRFGYRRSPFTRRWKFHSGLDISAPVGSPIVAPATGIVVTSQWHSGYGRLVEIDHGFGIISRYAHNSRVFVIEGQPLERGDLIATVGMTGQTTGPHLHFEVLLDGQPVDPLEYLDLDAQPVDPLDYLDLEGQAVDPLEYLE